MRSRIGCEFVYQSPNPAPMVFIVRPRERDAHLLLQESRVISPETHVHAYSDRFGNTCWRLVAPAGEMRLFYDAVAEHSDAPDPVFPDMPGTPVQQLPDDVMMFTLPSRFCQSDLVLKDAWALFSQTPDGWARVQAICDWTHTNIEYVKGSTMASTSGYEAYQQRKGVCRDYAHVGVMLCRAMNIPARYCCGYMADINVEPDGLPMDFHAWFEAYVGGVWRTFDARYNQPRVGRIVISRGRDAVDAALTTIYGPSTLTKFKVWSDLVADDFTLP
jgi:transglutaminase-like putative cysteine protease